MAKMRREGKCMRCGSTEHRLKTCTVEKPPMEKRSSLMRKSTRKAKADTTGKEEEDTKAQGKPAGKPLAPSAGVHPSRFQPKVRSNEKFVFQPLAFPLRKQGSLSRNAARLCS